VLSDQLHRAVVDKTGLSGNYDFTLEFAPDMRGFGPMPPGPGGPPGGPGAAPGPSPGGPSGPTASGPGGADESGPDILTAVREQLGLKLESKKMPVDMLIIDRADKVPTEN
jgi:uncharacterized protein (TIGR03435 family)